LRQSNHLQNLEDEDDKLVKFQSKDWKDKLLDENFKKAVLNIMDEEIVLKFEERKGDASSYYNLDEEVKK